MSILLNPCLSILPTFSALQTTVIPWSEMFPLFCECYSLYCSLNSKKMIELSLAFGPFVITISHYLSRYIRSNSNCQETQDPSLSLTIFDQDPCSPCLRVSSQNHCLTVFSRQGQKLQYCTIGKQILEVADGPEMQWHSCKLSKLLALFSSI